MNIAVRFMSNKIPKAQKLKSSTKIQFLFNKGKSIFNYPVKMQYIIQPDSDEKNGLQFGVSVSKKYFKKAVDRNELKRKMREGFRLHKETLENYLPGSEKNLTIMFLYVGKNKLEQSEISDSIIILIKKLHKKLTDSISIS
jgi:ribonuclease P protein component